MLDKRPFIGKYCDVQTKDGIWRLGVIEVSKLKDIIEVGLDGWSVNRNQKVCFHSNRIQPPRYYSKGYTGQSQSPLRNIDFDLTQISYIVNWLKLCHNFDFKNLPILDITNIFRCQMFILVDQIIHHPWNDFNKDTLEEDLKKVETLFTNILQISVMYLEKMPRFVSESQNLNYEKHSYLQSTPICYLEASYEIFLILKSIFGFTKRSDDFIQNNSYYLKTNFLNEFIELGSINLICRFMKEYKSIKLFQDKFYLIANILDLTLKIFNRSNHQKLNKSNQLKHINEIINFLNKENFIELINKNKDDLDVINLTDSLVEFAKNNKNFVEDSQKFNSFLKSINKEGILTKMSSGSSDLPFVKKVARKKSSGNSVIISNTAGKERRYSTNNLAYNLTSTAIQNGYTNLSSFGRSNLEKLHQNNTNNSEFLNKLSDIENKLIKLEDKLNLTTPAAFRPNPNYEKNPTSEFNIISPIREKENLLNFTDYKNNYTKELKSKENENLDSSCILLNSKNTYFSDPYDEISILSMIELNINENNLNHIKKIIQWRKRILEISKQNGWIVGKILAGNTIKKIEISDQDIIEANLTFLDKFNMIDRNSLEFNYKKIDYKSLFKDYENELLKALKE